jgi:DNA-binding response OmpR family regulator
MRIKRILMVEDDCEVAAAYRLRLQLDGFPVEVANTVGRALTLALRSRWDLVLLDVGLPGMSGLDVLAALRHDARTADVPVVILANRHDADLFERARGLGVIDYLIKTHTTPGQVSHSVPQWVATHGARPARLPTGVAAHGATAMATGNWE